MSVPQGLRYPNNMHSHAGHGHTHGTGRVLRISLAVTIVYVVLLVVAGIRGHSLALLSEAGHNLSDFLALLLSLAAIFLEGRPPSATKTYGYRRAGVLAALVNALSLVVVSFFIFYEAFQRIQHPEHVRARIMIVVAAAGVVMNGVIALLLWRSRGGLVSNHRPACNAAMKEGPTSRATGSPHPAGGIAGEAPSRTPASALCEGAT